MSNEETIQKLKLLVSSRKSMGGTYRAIRPEGDAEWSVSNLENQPSTYTIAVDSFEHAANVVGEVMDQKVDLDKFTSSFPSADKDKPLYLHLI